jgi:hypothetical protein
VRAVMFERLADDDPARVRVAMLEFCLLALARALQYEREVEEGE